MSKNESDGREIIETEVISVPVRTGLPFERMPITQADVDEAIKIAELQVDLRRKLLRVLVKTTSSRNWADFGGNPYLDAGGSLSFASTIGMKIAVDRPQKRMCKDESGEYYVFETGGIFEYQSISVTAYGAASSRDPFFAESHGERKPVYEVDETDIAKKAYTNCLNNGIKARLGLKSLEWSDLLAAGLNENDIAAIKFGAKKGDGQKSGSGSSSGSDEIKGKTPAEIREMIGEMIMEMSGGDMVDAANTLENITAWTNKEGKAIRGKRSIKEISDPAAPVVYGKVKKVFDEWKAATANGAGGQ